MNSDWVDRALDSISKGVGSNFHRWTCTEVSCRRLIPCCLCPPITWWNKTNWIVMISCIYRKCAGFSREEIRVDTSVLGVLLFSPMSSWGYLDNRYVHLHLLYIYNEVRYFTWQWYDRVKTYSALCCIMCVTLFSQPFSRSHMINIHLITRAFSLNYCWLCESGGFGNKARDINWCLFRAARIPKVPQPCLLAFRLTPGCRIRHQLGSPQNLLWLELLHIILKKNHCHIMTEANYNMKYLYCLLKSDCAYKHHGSVRNPSLNQCLIYFS